MRTVVVTDPPRADVEAAETLGGYGVATVHEALGRVGYLGPEFRPAWPGARMGGTAVTVLCWPGDNLMIHVAVEQCRPGDVLVVATNSPSTDGLFGELFATRPPAARRARGGARQRRAGRGRPARDAVPGVVPGGQRPGFGQGDRRRGQRAHRARRPGHPPGRRGARRRRRGDAGAARRRAARADRVEGPDRQGGRRPRRVRSEGELGLDRYACAPGCPSSASNTSATRSTRRVTASTDHRGGTEYDSTGVRCTMLRGGTSRGLYFEAGDLPADPAATRRPAAAADGHARPAADRRAGRRPRR